MTASAVESLLRPRKSPVLPFVAASVVAHVGLTVGFLLVSALLAGPRVDLDAKPIKASLVRLGKKRDDKLLPRKEEPAPPPPSKAEPAPTPAAAPDTAVKVPTKDAKPEKPSKDAKADAKDSKSKLFDALNKTSRAASAEELEGDPDGDANGDSAKQEGERYYALLSNAVRRRYDVSDTISEAERKALRAEVAIKLGPAGELLDVGLSHASGNELFDGAVVAAVKKAAPFGPPPEHLREQLRKQGVVFAFTP